MISEQESTKTTTSGHFGGRWAKSCPILLHAARGILRLRGPPPAGWWSDNQDRGRRDFSARLVASPPSDRYRCASPAPTVDSPAREVDRGEGRGYCSRSPQRTASRPAARGRKAKPRSRGSRSPARTSSKAGSSVPARDGTRTERTPLLENCTVCQKSVQKTPPLGSAPAVKRGGVRHWFRTVELTPAVLELD